MRVDREKCTGCRICQEKCKNYAISFVYTHDTFYIFVLDKKCKQCGECISHCPAEAIYEQ